MGLHDGLGVGVMEKEELHDSQDFSSSVSSKRTNNLCFPYHCIYSIPPLVGAQ